MAMRSRSRIPTGSASQQIMRAGSRWFKRRGRCYVYFHRSRTRISRRLADQLEQALLERTRPSTERGPDEGHGFQRPGNRLSYFAIAEAFFAGHLGGAFEPIGSDLEGSSHEIRAGSEAVADLIAR
jgi:hypothetical protein